MRKIEVLHVLALALAVSGCGVESASTAATAAAIKQKELEAGKKTMQEAEKQIGQSMQQLQENAQKSGEAGK
jgi:NifU-like protein involved in Fe-S cluster formation